MHQNTVERQRWRNECETHGIAWAEANRFTFNSEIAVYVIEWIEEYSRNESRARDEAHLALAEKSAAAAQLSANTSAKAAEASMKSARWTTVAAIAAAAGAIVPAVVAYAQFKGWMPK